MPTHCINFRVGEDDDEGDEGDEGDSDDRWQYEMGIVTRLQQ